jgi:hypothetical protein
MKRYCVLFLLPFCARAQGVYIALGANLVFTGNASITIQDGGLVNNGTLTAGNGTVLFTGTAASTSSTIGGSSTTTFNHLTIDKTSNDVVLNGNIAVNGNLTMQAGNLQLNNYTLDLGSGAGTIVGESNSTRITGLTGGSVNKTAVLDAPAAVNPGNIGVEITSAANMGSTLISRGHKQQTSAGGGLSIDRYFDITPATNSGLNATLKFYYFDNELAGRNKAELNQWTSADGGTTWTLLGSDQADVSADWVLKNNLGQFARTTLASTITDPLPVRLLDFTGVLLNGETHLSWTTASEYDNDHFELERSSDAAVFVLFATVKSQGNGNTPQTYQYTDLHPLTGYTFYRLKQVDLEGKSTFSPVISVQTNVPSSASVFPNPAMDAFTLSIDATVEYAGRVSLVDISGKLIGVRNIHLVPGANTFSWNISHLASGSYFLWAEGFPMPVLQVIKK